jgi:hypothetical protein
MTTRFTRALGAIAETLALHGANDNERTAANRNAPVDRIGAAESLRRELNPSLIRDVISEVEFE